jgi:hypothetical protein
VCHQIAVVALSMFDEAEDGADKDEKAATIHCVNVPLPRRLRMDDFPSRSILNPNVELDGGPQKQRKEYQLYD